MSPDPLPFPLPNWRAAVDVPGLLGALSQAIDHAHLDEITVKGRLTGWRRTRTWGHAELVASSDDGTDARVPLGFPGRVAAAIEARCARAGTPLGANPTVAVTGGLEVHPRYGPVRFVVRALTVDHAATNRNHADRAAAVHQLEHAGVLRHQQTLRLPTTITTVGIIAGAGTAARADFRERISRLPDSYALHELEVPTAGPAAPTAIAAAIARLGRRNLDCIAILRGGGPAADLTTFDHPDLATAIGRCTTPILTGIGHATNTTLADRVAHRALPTPSAVADHIGRHNAAHTLDRAARTADHAQRAAAAARQALDTARIAGDANRARLRLAVALSVVLVIVLAVALVV